MNRFFTGGLTVLCIMLILLVAGVEYFKTVPSDIEVTPLLPHCETCICELEGAVDDEEFHDDFDLTPEGQAMYDAAKEFMEVK